MTELGAYGLLLPELASCGSELFVTANEDWIPWRIEYQVRQVDQLASFRYRDEISPDHALLTNDPQGYTLVDRSRSVSTLHLDHEPSLQELVHPGLALTAATFAWWSGRLALHGSAVSRDDRTIAFLADRDHGKSSTAAWLLSQGWDSVSDDLLVIERHHVFAGPRIVDLRRQTAELWGLGTYLGVVGTRERWRMRTGPVNASTQLAAVVVLRWGDRCAVERVRPADRIATFLSYRALDLQPNPAALLQLLSVPTYTFTRPRDIEAMETTMNMLLERLGVN